MKENNVQKVKVLHIIASPVIGGAEKIFLTLVNRIDHKNFDIRSGIFIDERLGYNQLWDEASKLDVLIKPIRIRNPYDLRQVLDLYKMIKQFRPNIVHCHGYKTNLLGFLMAKIFRISIVTTFHGWFQANTIQSKIFNKLSLMVLKKVTKIIAVSEQIKTKLIQMRCKSDKIVILRNIPPYSNFNESINHFSFKKHLNISQGKKIFGFIGRLELVKGCHILLEAISIVVKENSNFVFVIVGDGPERDALHTQVIKFKLEKYVYFLGFRQDIKNIMQSLDYIILPSLNEGTPLVLLEAMQHGIPVIATEVGGIPEVIQDGYNGILVPSGNPKLLANAIEKSIANTEETQKRVLNAKKTIDKEFNSDNWIQRVENIYFDIVKYNK